MLRCPARGADSCVTLSGGLLTFGAVSSTELCLLFLQRATVLNPHIKEFLNLIKLLSREQCAVTMIG